MSSIGVITGARLIDGAGGILNDPLIVIEDARIRAVGTRGALEVPPGAVVIDAQDCTLMPGLIDAHVHLGAFNCTSFGNARVSRFEVTPQLQ
jgi:imidazolonepropionase-like amidohydrolase